jgi:hypothetical protein
MTSITKHLSTASICALIFAQSNGAGTMAPAQSSVPSAGGQHCAAPEYRQFDFWIGDWDAFDLDDHNAKIAHNRVTPMLDGCVC